MCPHCEQSVIKDFNDMPQRMWKTDTQEWTCEGCGERVVRHFTGSRWTEWSKRS